MRDEGGVYLFFFSFLACTQYNTHSVVRAEALTHSFSHPLPTASKDPFLSYSASTYSIISGKEGKSKN